MWQRVTLIDILTHSKRFKQKSFAWFILETDRCCSYKGIELILLKLLSKPYSAFEEGALQESRGRQASLSAMTVTGCQSKNQVEIILRKLCQDGLFWFWKIVLFENYSFFSQCEFAYPKKKTFSAEFETSSLQAGRQMHTHSQD